MINLRCILFGHKFKGKRFVRNLYDGELWETVYTQLCVKCGLTKEECGIKLKNN